MEGSRLRARSSTPLHPKHCNLGFQAWGLVQVGPDQDSTRAEALPIASGLFNVGRSMFGKGLLSKTAVASGECDAAGALFWVGWRSSKGTRSPRSSCFGSCALFARVHCDVAKSSRSSKKEREKIAKGSSTWYLQAATSRERLAGLQQRELPESRSTELAGLEWRFWWARTRSPRPLRASRGPQERPNPDVPQQTNRDQGACCLPKKALWLCIWVLAYVHIDSLIFGCWHI